MGDLWDAAATRNAIDELEPEPEDSAPSMPESRAYQKELLEESIRRNVIIALDTGSGKTHIAVLRLRHETERSPNKTCWFFAPTIGLCEQQRDVIKTSLPVPVGMITGVDAPDQWTDKALWRTLLTSHRIVVSTPQVFLDALRHGYVDMGSEISLLVFDEAHHAADGHPYHMIMKEFYHRLPPRRADGSSGEKVRPAVLGLTASPMFGGNVDLAFEKLEKSLDSIICTALTTRAELAQHVHLSTFKHISYPPPAFKWGVTPSPSQNLTSLSLVLSSLNIAEDPYITSLQAKLSKLPNRSSPDASPSPERLRLDQMLSKALDKQDTFTLKGLRDFHRAAEEICYDLGVWAADWYVQTVVQHALAPIDPLKHMFLKWQQKEKQYLLAALKRIHITPVSYAPEVIAKGVSAKTSTLIKTLLEEKKAWDDVHEMYSGLVFVTRRDAVIALTAILTHHSLTSPHFTLGALLGSSNSSKRHTLLDITSTLFTQSLAQTLRAFRIGEKNLIVATAVAEEGIDIQACGSVVRWDPPQNMVSWVQSRGRARRQRSCFVLMFEEGGPHAKVVRKWEAAEKEMIAAYLKERENIHKTIPVIDEEEGDQDDEGESEGGDELYFRVESTGAVLSLSSAVAHLAHFCAVIPSTRHAKHEPIYSLDPPDYPFEFHHLPLHRRRLLAPSSPSSLTPPGPWTATLTLPRPITLPSHPSRTFTTPTAHPSKKRARMHVAYEAYRALYEGGLVDEHLLPWSSMARRGIGIGEEEEEVRKALKEVEKRDGTAVVSVQMRAWVPGPALDGVDRQKHGERWWMSELSIQGVATITLLTLVPFSEDFSAESEVLFDPTTDSSVGTREVRMRAGGRFEGSEEDLMDAKRYTRQMFSIFYGTRMKWEEMQFVYLILPADLSPAWMARRKWADGLCAGRSVRWRPENRYVVDAVAFGEAFAYPSDMFLVRDILHGNTSTARPYEFVRWRKDRLNMEELLALTDRYPISVKDAEAMNLPSFIEARPLPRRRSFLVPVKARDQEDGKSFAQTETVILLSQYTAVALAPASDIRVCMLLPSLFRILSVKLTTHSLRTTIMPPSLQSLPLPLLRIAHVAPVASESYNYQRLETLGDVVLKFLVSVQLLGQFPLWHEGYLARRKDHVVANGSLARAAVRVGLYRWVVRDRFTPRTWRPEVVEGEASVSSSMNESESVCGSRSVVDGVDGEDDWVVYPRDSAQHTQAKTQTQTQNETKANRKNTEQKAALSTKMMADVVEALIGACYLHAGFQGGIDCISAFGLDMVWKTVPERIAQMLAQIEPVELDGIPPHLTHVEAILGYTFQRKPLLIEALMHASFQSELQTRSYERMEFLGDSVLDMIVTETLYRAKGKHYGPGHLHMKKSACVNTHFLGYICLRACTQLHTQLPKSSMSGRAKVVGDRHVVYLWQCILHSSPSILTDLMVTFARYEVLKERLEYMLRQDRIFPWAALTRLQIPKFFSDIVESLIGAVYLDTEGDLERVKAVLETLGIIPVLQRVIQEDVDVLHPISRIAIMASQAQLSVRYDEKVAGGFATVKLLIEEEEIHSASERYRGKASVLALRFQVAEESVGILTSMIGGSNDRYHD